jgi:hypothetical protein
MSLSFRTLAIGIGVMGIALGVAFGAGVAYGRGDPKTVQAGLTQQQIQQLYGAPTNPGAAAATGGAGAGQGAAGAGQNAGTGGTAALAARATSGRVTAVSGQTVTIETARGSQKVNVASSTSINKISGGAASDIAEGTTIFASGTRKDDGSFDATAVSQVTSDLAQLLSTLTGAGAGGSAPASTTPTR